MPLHVPHFLLSRSGPASAGLQLTRLSVWGSPPYSEPHFGPCFFQVRVGEGVRGNNVKRDSFLAEGPRKPQMSIVQVTEHCHMASKIFR